SVSDLVLKLLVMYPLFCSFFFFNDTATTEIYTLSLHDALPISPVHPSGDVPLQVVSAHVASDTDDRAPVLVIQQPNVLPNNVLVGPITLRPLGGDNRHGSARQVGMSELSAGKKGNTHNAKIVGSYDMQPEERRCPAARNDETFQVQGTFGDTAAERKSIHKSGPVDSGRGLDPVQQSAVEGQAPLEIAAKGLVGSNR